MAVTVGNAKEGPKDSVGSWEKAKNLVLGWKNYSHGHSPEYRLVSQIKTLP